MSIEDIEHAVNCVCDMKITSVSHPEWLTALQLLEAIVSQDTAVSHNNSVDDPSVSRYKIYGVGDGITHALHSLLFEGFIKWVALMNCHAQDTKERTQNEHVRLGSETLHTITRTLDGAVVVPGWAYLNIVAYFRFDRFCLAALCRLPKDALHCAMAALLLSFDEVSPSNRERDSHVRSVMHGIVVHIIQNMVYTEFNCSLVKLILEYIRDKELNELGVEMRYHLVGTLSECLARSMKGKGQPMQGDVSTTERIHDTARHVRNAMRSQSSGDESVAQAARSMLDGSNISLNVLLPLRRFSNTEDSMKLLRSMHVLDASVGAQQDREIREVPDILRDEPMLCPTSGSATHLCEAVQRDVYATAVVIITTASEPLWYVQPSERSKCDWIPLHSHLRVLYDFGRGTLCDVIDDSVEFLRACEFYFEHTRISFPGNDLSTMAATRRSVESILESTPTTASVKDDKSSLGNGPSMPSAASPDELFLESARARVVSLDAVLSSTGNEWVLALEGIRDLLTTAPTVNQLVDVLNDLSLYIHRACGQPSMNLGTTNANDTIRAANVSLLQQAHARGVAFVIDVYHDLPVHTQRFLRQHTWRHLDQNRTTRASATTCADDVFSPLLAGPSAFAAFQTHARRSFNRVTHVSQSKSSYENGRNNTGGSIQTGVKNTSLQVVGTLAFVSPYWGLQQVSN